MPPIPRKKYCAILKQNNCASVPLLCFPKVKLLLDFLFLPKNYLLMVQRILCSVFLGTADMKSSEVRREVKGMKSYLQYELCLGPIQRRLEAFLGFLVKTQMKAYKKLTVVMCCQIVARKSVAPSSGDFWRRSVPR